MHHPLWTPIPIRMQAKEWTPSLSKKAKSTSRDQAYRAYRLFTYGIANKSVMTEKFVSQDYLSLRLCFGFWLSYVSLCSSNFIKNAFAKLLPIINTIHHRFTGAEWIFNYTRKYNLGSWHNTRIVVHRFLLHRTHRLSLSASSASQTPGTTRPADWPCSVWVIYENTRTLWIADPSAGGRYHAIGKSTTNVPIRQLSPKEQTAASFRKFSELQVCLIIFIVEAVRYAIDLHNPVA